MKKVFFKILPYLASILAGLIFLIIGLALNENIRGLFINISAAFFAIPLIFFFYQIAQNFSQKKLNKEIFDYAKMQIDKEILSIVNHLYKIVYPLEEVDFSFKGIGKFLSTEREKIKQIISEKEYLGFQIFKKWEVIENNLHDVLKNSYMLKRLEDNQIIAIISILKSFRNLENIQKIENLYVKSDNKITKYKISKGKELHEENIKFPDRYLLLKKLVNDKFIVYDFGDFALYNEDKLLQVFRVNDKHLEIYSYAIFDMIEEINNWLNLTGEEFVIDTKMFQLRREININK